MAQYYIGDVQGCFEPLQRLLKRIQFDPAKDRLVFCGDLVNRGGQSLEVLRLVRSLRRRAIVVLGNHDFHLLAEDQRYPDGNSPNRDLRRVLQAEDRVTLIEWLAGQRLAYWHKPYRLLAVHAGVIPQWTAKQALKHAAEVEAVLRSPKRGKFLRRLYRDRHRLWQDDLSGMDRRAMITHILTRIRYCDAHGKLNLSATGPPGTQPAGYLPWFRHKHRLTRDIRIAFGHWASLGTRIKKRYMALDSGCVWGGKLSAWRVEDGRLFQVPCKARKRSRKKA